MNDVNHLEDILKQAKAIVATSNSSNKPYRRPVPTQPQQPIRQPIRDSSDRVDNTNRVNNMPNRNEPVSFSKFKKERQLQRKAEGRRYTRLPGEKSHKGAYIDYLINNRFDIKYVDEFKSKYNLR